MLDLKKRNKKIHRKYGYDPDIPLKLDLYPYQKAGINFGCKSLKKYRSFILADEMGVGKSIQAIGMALKTGAKRILVVCPANARGSWKKILNAHTGLSYNIVYNRDCLEARCRCTVINYDKLKVIANSDLRDRFDFIIIDESHNIKNKEALRSQLLKKLSARYRVFLSGTPILNRLEELWVMLNIIDPHAFGNYQEYVTRYSKMKKIRIRARYGRRFYWRFITKFYGGKNIDELRELINPYFLRRTKKEVLPWLPDKIEQTITVDLTPKQRKMYDSIVKKLKVKIDKNEITIKSAMAQFTRTRQICGTTASLGDKDHSATLDALEDLVKNYLYGEHKFFIVAPFKATAKCAYERLKKIKINCVYVDGDTNPIDVNKSIDKFQNNSKCKVFVGTIDKNKEAITLTSADYVIFLGKSLVPKINEQTMDRLHRIGQKNVVNAISIINRDTVEEKIEECILAPKIRLFDDFMDGVGSGTALHLGHIRKLIS